MLTQFVFIGAGESGKSTILKQMKLIYAQGFNKNERLDFKPVIFNNIVQSFKTISEAMTEMGFEYDTPDNEVSSSTSWHSGALYNTRMRS
jgi:guanine nucleotide-binding protein subunit alpha